MRHVVVMMLSWMFGFGFPASALSAEAVSGNVSGVAPSDALDFAPVLASETPPAKPEGDEQPGGDSPPAKPGEETGGSSSDNPPEKPGEDTGGGSSDTTVLTGVLTLNGGTNTLDGIETGGTLVSTTSDENVILVQTNASLTISNYTLTKSGDTSSEDNSNFFALNAVVAAKTAGKIYLDNCTLNSNAEGANCLFASGSGSTIYAYGCTLTSTKSSSRGLDATYEGTVIGAKLTIDTASDHCAALATDRGNGYISATEATLTTAGQGSPLIYSTGIIEANGVTGTATGAQIAGIEGLSTIRIRNSSLTGSGEKASEPVANGVIIYQSNSGDSTDGTATFEVSDSTLTSAITNGALFYVTHSEAIITVRNTALAFDADKNVLLKAAGNDGSNGWGNAGSNGAEVVFTVLDQTLAGNVSVDGTSSLDMYLTNATYTGTFVNDTTYTGDGDGIDLFLGADSTWIVTADCTLETLTVAPGASIVDESGKTVSIVASGTTRVTGTGSLTVTVSSYAQGDVAIPHSITDFEIDRSAFEALYGTSQSQEAVTPGVVSAPYADAQAATNAAVAINANKADCIDVPTGVEGSAKTTYLTKVAATVTSDNCVVIDLTSAARAEVQTVLDEAVTNESAVVALTSTNQAATATLATTTPGLYYWIQGGTDAGAVTQAGQAELSKTGGSVTLSKPALDATKGKAFFRIAAGVSAPAQ